MEGGEGELVSDMPARSFASRHSERIMSCLMGFFFGRQQPCSSLEGCDKGRKKGKKELQLLPCGPTYKRHCIRGRRHDGREEIHKNC